MIVLGLTGGIAMGKSAAVRALRRRGLPVAESDWMVHRLLAPGGTAVATVAAAFPGVLAGGGIDRRKLGQVVFGDGRRLAQLEAILHPLVRRESNRFLLRMALARRRLVALDVPLLFETGAQGRFGAIITMTAPAFLQRARALARPGVDEARLAGVLARQLPDAVRRRRADFVVATGLDRRNTLRGLVRALALIAGGWRPGRRQFRRVRRGQPLWRVGDA